MVTLAVFAMMVHLTTLTCFHPLQKRLVQIENSGPMINLKEENRPILKKFYSNQHRHLSWSPLQPQIRITIYYIKKLIK